MPHLLLTVEPVGQREERGVEAGQRPFQTMRGYAEGLKRTGVLMASSALAAPLPQLDAARQRLRNRRAAARPRAPAPEKEIR